MLHLIHGIILPMDSISHPWIIRLSMDDYVIHGSVSYISWAKIPPLAHGIHGRYISFMDIVLGPPQDAWASTMQPPKP